LLNFNIKYKVYKQLLTDKPSAHMTDSYALLDKLSHLHH